MVKLVRTSKRHRWNNFTLWNTDQGCKELYYNKKFRDLKSFFVLGGSIVHTSDGASASAEGEENMTRFQYRHLKRKRKRRRMQGNKNFAVSCVFVGACICNCISHVWTLSMQTQPNTRVRKVCTPCWNAESSIVGTNQACFCVGRMNISFALCDPALMGQYHDIWRNPELYLQHQNHLKIIVKSA